MRRGRDPSRTPSRPRRLVFDNPRRQLPGTGIRSDAENLYSGNLYGLWILNPLKTSGGQPVALGGFGVWLGGYFLARLIIFVFVDFSVFYERCVA